MDQIEKDGPVAEQVTPALSVLNSEIRAALDGYRMQYDQTAQSLQHLEADYANKKMTGTNLLNQLHGAIAALQMLVPADEPATPDDAPKTE